MILNDCQQLKQKIDRYEEIQRRHDHAKSLKQRRDELEEERAELRKTIQSMKVLVGAQLLDQSVLPSAKNAKNRLEAVRRLFHDDPSQITKGDDYQVFLSEIVDIRKEVDEHCQRTWERFTAEITPAVEQELLREREEIPEFEKVVKKIRLLVEELDEAAQYVPTTNSELSNFEETAEALREALEEVYSDEYPPAVIEFLRAANTRRGAALSQLTPTVLQWLEDHDKMDGFRIQTKN